MSFDARTDARATTIASTDVLVFGAVGADAWDTITAANFISSQSILTGTGGGSTSADPSAWSGTVYDLDADDIAGADGSAVSSWSPRRDTGSIGNVTQGTGANQPSLKTAANGINGRNVVRFAGPHRLVSAAFGAQITGDYYCACVVRVNGNVGSGLSVSFWQFGDSSPAVGKARVLYQSGGSGSTYTFAYHTVGGQNTFFPAVTTFTAGSAVYLLEVIQRGARATVFVNGSPVISRASKDYSAFTAGVLTIGSTGFTLACDLARFTLSGTVPTPAQRSGYRAYLAARYGITLAPEGGFARFTGSAVADESEAITQASGLTSLGMTVVDGYTPARVGGPTGAALNQEATLTVYGPLAAITEQQEHRVVTQWSLFNVCSFQNSASQGYSAVRFLRYTGEEMAAFGYAQPSLSPFGGVRGSSYWEASNFKDISPAKWGDARIVQTKNGTSTLRWRLRDDTQAIEEYDQTWTEPADGGVSAGLVSLRGLPSVSVADAGTLDTGIPTGAGHCGLLVVKDATNSRCALYRLENATLTAVSADAEFSTTGGNAGTVNVFANSGQIRLENKTGGALTLTAAYYGA